VTVRAKSADLRPVSVTVTSIAFPAPNGYSTSMPAMDKVVPGKPLAVEASHERTYDAATGAADRKYSAVDLMEVAVKAGSTVWVAHDDRLPRPSWLTGQFQPSGTTAITVDGKRMRLFVHQAARPESMTLGANGEGEANMYVVFVK
jgi:hypothetical protein